MSCGVNRKVGNRNMQRKSSTIGFLDLNTLILRSWAAFQSLIINEKQSDWIHCAKIWNVNFLIQFRMTRWVTRSFPNRTRRCRHQQNSWPEVLNWSQIESFKYQPCIFKQKYSFYLAFMTKFITSTRTRMTPITAVTRRVMTGTCHRILGRPVLCWRARRDG